MTTAINPARHALMSLYTDIHKGLTSLGIVPKSIVGDRREIKLTPEGEQVFNRYLIEYTFEQQVYLRLLNDAHRYDLGDDLMQVAMVLNERFPRVKDQEIRERENNLDPVTLLEGEVLSAESLIFDHMAKENTGYLRRLIASSVIMHDYSMRHTPLTPQDQDEMENITAQWLLDKVKHDEDIFKIMSMTDKHGVPMEMKTMPPGRYRFIYEILPSLIALSSFRRSETTHFARFVTLLPSLLIWTIGNYDAAMKQEEEDPLMDIVESILTFSKTLNANADMASRLRQMLHHGFPVYKELIALAKGQKIFMSWNFESIILRFASNLPVILRNRDNKATIISFMIQTGILEKYAVHKHCFVNRD